MDDARRAILESDIRSSCARADWSTATTVAIRGYGGEIFGFLVAVLRDETEAADTFADVSEALWSGLPSFAWASSFRTWAYAVARNVARARRRGVVRHERRLAQGGNEALDELVEKVRTETLSFLQTAKRSRLQALRDALPEEDRMLLVLRVDRNLSWSDLARVLSEEAEAAPMDAVAVAREAARLRKRFQIVKDKLRERARRERLID